MLRFEKLSEYNFHVWKQKIKWVLAYYEVYDAALKDDTFQRDSPEFLEWKHHEKTSRAIIVLSLSDDMLDHVRECETAKQMLGNIKIVFRRHIVLIKLQRRREFYTVEMNQNVKTLSYINQAQHHRFVLKSMEVDIDSKEMAVAILNGLPPQ